MINYKTGKLVSIFEYTDKDFRVDGIDSFTDCFMHFKKKTDPEDSSKEVVAANFYKIGEHVGINLACKVWSSVPNPKGTGKSSEGGQAVKGLFGI